jgi:release factor glutamine methyltransferase
MKSIGETLQQAAQQLRMAGIPEARREAELLLAACLKRERAWLLAHPEWQLRVRELRRFERWLARRARREPLAYITHQRWFYGVQLYVGRGVLIPRPETEQLVELFLQRTRTTPQGVLVDAGTGSGCIALACLLNAPGWRAVGIDRSRRALRIAARNRDRYALRHRWLLLHADWLAPLRPACVDVILANPPYVLPHEWDTLPPEIARYEPKRALLAPRADPLRPYRQLMQQAATVLKPGGWLAMETSLTLANSVRDLLAPHGYYPIETGQPYIVGGERLTHP